MTLSKASCVNLQKCAEFHVRSYRVSSTGANYKPKEEPELDIHDELEKIFGNKWSEEELVVFSESGIGSA